jgi:hypothetical protein
MPLPLQCNAQIRHDKKNTLRSNNSKCVIKFNFIANVFRSLRVFRRIIFSYERLLLPLWRLSRRRFLLIVGWVTKDLLCLHNYLLKNGAFGPGCIGSHPLIGTGPAWWFMTHSTYCVSLHMSMPLE